MTDTARYKIPDEIYSASRQNEMNDVLSSLKFESDMDTRN